MRPPLGFGHVSDGETQAWRKRLGAYPVGDDAVEFRVWAPHATEVCVRLGGTLHRLEPVGDGVFEELLSASAGDDYWIILDGASVLPDPCTRFQPEGSDGPSRVVDMRRFEWSETDWVCPGLNELVLYELHVGSFSAEGTFDGVIPYLGRLRELGVTAIELMPIASFAGDRNWGYDGVHLFAPHRAYGEPAGLARLVDAAHREGLAVILDVVYNHVGLGAEALAAFGPYFSERGRTPWGPPFNFDGADSEPVREWIFQCACQWVEDYRVDGFRLDAIWAMRDVSRTHVVSELVERVRHVADRPVLVTAEADPSDPRLRADRLFWGIDAWWSDPFHHALHAVLTGERGGYYASYGRVEDLARAFEQAHDPQLVVYAQNHDQVGNRPRGDRLEPPIARLGAFCVLFSSFVPLLFMGEEYGERAPFPFFTDHPDEDFAGRVRRSRARYLRGLGFTAKAFDPQAPETFACSRLDPEAGDVETVRLYRELIAVRRALPPGDVIVFHDDNVLRVHRGAYELVCNFAADAADVPTDREDLVLETGGARLECGRILLPALAGAILR